MPDFPYDVYISYSPADAEWVREWLLPRLESAGIKTCVDFRDFRIGAPKLTELERGLLESRKTLLVLTPAFLESEWNDFASVMVQHLDPAARQLRILPLILKPTDLPLRINTLVPLDFTKLTGRLEQLPRLIRAIKPDAAPPAEQPPPGPDIPAPDIEYTPPAAARPLSAYEQEMRDLLDYLRRGKLLLFIGPDLPEALTAAPDRYTLARTLAQDKGLPFPGERIPGKNLSVLAQQIMAGGNRYEFTQFLKTKLTGLQPGPFYHVLAHFIRTTRPQTVLTTAYHRLLEASLEAAGEYSLQTVTNDDLIPFIEPGAPVLYKLFGDIQQADLIVTEQDLNAFLRGRMEGRQTLFDEAIRLLQRNSVLFLGVDPRDAAILALLDEVAQGRFQNPAFAVWSGLPETEAKSLETSRGLRILEVDAVELVRFLGEQVEQTT